MCIRDRYRDILFYLVLSWHNLGYPILSQMDSGRTEGYDTPAELNSILQNHVVRDRNGCALTTFGCVEWESELYRGVMLARCYPWNMPKHRFHKMNPQVIPCYPWLYTYITGYPGIFLANDAAPGLLLDSPAAWVSPALPVQPGGPL